MLSGARPAHVEMNVVTLVLLTKPGGALGVGGAGFHPSGLRVRLPQGSLPGRLVCLFCVCNARSLCFSAYPSKALVFHTEASCIKNLK